MIAAPITPYTAAQQLVSRGLGSLAPCSPEALCEEIAERLSYVSLYRLFPFWAPFLQKGSRDLSSFVGGVFVPGATWDVVLGSYMFDRKLRSVIMEPISRIEVALRTQLAFHWAAASKNEFPHRNLSTYKSSFLKPGKDGDSSPRKRLWETVEKNFQRHKKEQGEIYEDVRQARGLQDLTIHAFMEYTTLGNLERLLRVGLKHKIVKAVAQGMGFRDVDFFVSCVSMLKDVRNACAHQSRVWNSYWRTGDSLPILRNAIPGFTEHVQEERTGAALTVCQLFMRTIAPHSRWKERLLELLNAGYIPAQQVHLVLGFSSHLWYEHPFWATK